MDVHFNAQKVKFVDIAEMVKPLRRSMDIKSVNVYINFDDILHRLHNPMGDEEFKAAGENAHKQLIMNILNFMAHYRQAFVRCGWNVKIIGYYTVNIYTGNNIPVFRNSLYVENYRSKFLTITSLTNEDYFHINNATINAVRMIETMCRYIDGVYMLNSGALEPSLMPLYMSNQFPADWHFVISKDPYDLQYAIREKWSVIVPGSTKKACYISGMDVWQYIAGNNKSEDINLNISPVWLPYAMACVGDQYRNIPKIKRVGWKTMLKLLQEFAGSSFDTEVYAASRMMLISGLVKNDNQHKELVEKNFSVIDLDTQLARMNKIDRAILQNQYMDAIDYENLNQMCRIYFKDYPINIPFLLDNAPEKHSGFGMGYMKFR